MPRFVRPLLALALVLPLAALLVGARSDSTAPAFDITLTRTASGWSVTCDTGCDWTELAVSCVRDCRVRIDAAGVTTKVSTTETTERFGFIVGRGTDQKWAAQSLGGTAWKTIGWTCMTDRCRARIDDSGVSPYLL